MSVWVRSCSLVSPGGSNLEENVETLFSGEDCLTPRVRNGVATLSERVVERINDLRFSSPALKKLDESVLLALLASNEVFEKVPNDSRDTSVIFGSSRGAAHALEVSLKSFLSSEKLPAYTSPVTTANTLPSTIARFFELTGSHFSLSAACSTGLHCLGVASALISTGHVSSVLVGASEFTDTPFVREILTRAKVLASKEYRNYPHRPMCKDRSGMVLSSGASCILLSDRSEGALAEIIGYAGSTELAGLTGISKEGVGIVSAIKRALLNAQLESKDIDIIIGHGSSTLKGDEAEQAAIRHCFGNRRVPVIYHKWMTGHMLGASSMSSVALACRHLNEGIWPNLPYLQDSDSRNLDINVMQTSKVKYALIIAMGFGGNSAALVVKSKS